MRADYDLVGDHAVIRSFVRGRDYKTVFTFSSDDSSVLRLRWYFP